MPERTTFPDANQGRWSFRFETLNEASSAAFAADLAGCLEQGDIVALDGDLGLGKSTLARALLRARAGNPELEVPSPTFTLVQSYDLEDLEISHFDLYRISDFEELFEIGLEESWQNGAAMIEWPDRAEELLPDETLWLHFEPCDGVDARKLTLSGSSTWGLRLQRVCEKRALLLEAGWGDATTAPIKGDLSPRNYDRVLRPETAAGEATCAILMDMPAREPGPVLPDGRLYDLVAHRVTSLGPMISIAQGLEDLGLRVPDIYGYDLNAGLMLWEDFGEQTLAEKAERPIAERYVATITSLAQLHNKQSPIAFSGSGGVHSLSHYDTDAFLVELDVFLDHYWPHATGKPISTGERDTFYHHWETPLKALQEAQQALILRDVQDPNCFWLGEHGGQSQIGFIDFQDCLLGPAAYDVAALCMDARVDISDDLRETMLTRYQAERQLDPDDWAAFEQAFAICALQRNSKNLGAFARAANQHHRPSYLTHIPRGLTYAAIALEHPLLSSLKDWYYQNKLLPNV